MIGLLVHTVVLGHTGATGNKLNYQDMDGAPGTGVCIQITDWTGWDGCLQKRNVKLPNKVGVSTTGAYLGTLTVRVFL